MIGRTLGNRLAALERVAAAATSNVWVRAIMPEGLTEAAQAAWLAAVQAENPGANIIVRRIVGP